MAGGVICLPEPLTQFLLRGKFRVLGKSELSPPPLPHSCPLPTCFSFDRHLVTHDTDLHPPGHRFVCVV